MGLTRRERAAMELALEVLRHSALITTRTTDGGSEQLSERAIQDAATDAAGEGDDEMTTTTTAATITDEQIERLEQEAGNAGDLEMAATCRRALDGDDAARAECARVIRDAQAMAD